MKKTFLKLTCVLLCLCTITFTLCACHNESYEIALKTGHYFLSNNEDYGFGTTPYIHINTNENTISISQGLLYSYIEFGDFEINNTTLTATTQNATFTFTIEDSSTLILVENHEFFELPENATFIYSEDMH